MRLLSALQVAATLGLLFPARAGAKERWLEVKTPHFIVVTDTEEKRALGVARDFEAIRVVFQMALPRARTAEARLPILAVKDEKGLKKLLPEFWERKDSFRPGGVFRHAGYRREIALILGKGGSEAYPLVYHEYFHYLVDLNTPGLPSWLNEGLASYWENTTIENEGVVVGNPSGRHIQVLKAGTPLPLRELLTARPFTVDRDRVSMFYAQSWVLTHYLLIGDRAIRQESLSEYVKRVTDGEDVVEAATAAFGDLDALEDALRAYTRRFLFTTLQIRASAEIDVGTFETRSLTEAESLALQGRFVVAGGLPEKAEPFLESALKQDSRNPVAAEGMGLLEMRRGNREESERWLRRSVQSPQASAVAHFLLATLLSDAALKEQHLLETIGVDRNFAPAFVELSYHYGATDASLGRALAMATEAAVREPGNADNRLLVARILRRMGRDEEAVPNVQLAVRTAIWSAHGAAANNVCWYGSLAGFAIEVMSACDQAVRHQPDYVGFRDSRGLARALVGDFEGAAADFQSFVDAGQRSPEAIAQRRDWIRILEEGTNPIDEKTRAELLNRPF